MSRIPLHILSVLFVVALFQYSNTTAQTCGFGCLGLSGFYGGYTFQYYKADGLNEHIRTAFENFSSDFPDIQFDKGAGFRIGANIFRAKFDNYFLTAKGFFQFLQEEKEGSVQQSNGLLTKNYQMTINYWGIGIDFGIPLLNFVDMKLVEGGITFFNTKFNDIRSLNNIKLDELQYENDKLNVGYYVATGLIIHLIQDYLSIEGSASYNILKIDKLEQDDGTILPSSSISTNFIKSGGFAATLQLNIGIPL